MEYFYFDVKKNVYALIWYQDDFVSCCFKDKNWLQVMHGVRLQMCFICAIFFSLSKGDKSSIAKEILGAWGQGFGDLVTVDWEFSGANLKGI